MSEFFNLRRDWMWLVGLPVGAVAVLGLAFGWWSDLLSEPPEKPVPLQGTTLQYVGVWNGKNEQLKISANGTGSYFSFGEKWLATRLTISDSAIVLHYKRHTKSFRITRPPFVEEGKTIIELNGQIFERGGGIDPRLRRDH